MKYEQNLNMKHEQDFKTVAVFIDADNVPAKKIDFIINELANYGAVMVRKIYGNWKSDRLKGWEEVLLDYALAPVQQFDYTKGKNVTDMALTIDVMDMLYSGKIDVFCIVSSDSDFTPLAMRVKTEGKQVIGFGRHSTSKALVAACNKFLFLDDKQHVITELNVNVASSRRNGNQLKMDTALMNLLRNAVADCCDENGWASLNRVGQVVSNQSSFDSKNYGYAKLGDLIRAIDIFETQLAENRSQLLVRNKRQKQPI